MPAAKKRQKRALARIGNCWRRGDGKISKLFSCLCGRRMMSAPTEMGKKKLAKKLIEVLGVENARNFVKIDENSAPLQTLSAWIEEEYAEMPEKKIDDYLRSVQPMLQKKFDWCEQVCSDEERAATATYTATYAVERALPDNSNYPRFNIVISDYPPILTASEKSRIRQTLRDMVRENCAELKHAPLEVKFG